MRRSFLLLLLFVSARVSVWAEAPNIVFITVDTTRADRMGFLGNTHGLTPNLDLLARQGVVFESAYSQAPLTPVSHATIFTGTYPQFHTVTDFGHSLPTLLPYLPDILHARGYQTAAFVSSVILDPIQGAAPGFDRGFDRTIALQASDGGVALGYEVLQVGRRASQGKGKGRSAGQVRSDCGCGLRIDVNALESRKFSIYFFQRLNQFRRIGGQIVNDLNSAATKRN